MNSTQEYMRSVHIRIAERNEQTYARISKQARAQGNMEWAAMMEQVSQRHQARAEELKQQTVH